MDSKRNKSTEFSGANNGTTYRIPRYSAIDRSPRQYLEEQREEAVNEWYSNDPVPEVRESLPTILRANESRLYDPADYSGRSLKYQAPSVILNKRFMDSAQIGIISTGPLCDTTPHDAIGIARLTMAPEADYLAGLLPYIGVKITAKADLARTVYQTYGVWPEISADLIKRCVEGLDDDRPANRRIRSSLDVVMPGEKLPTFGEEPKGCLIQFRDDNGLFNVVFYQRNGDAVFRGIHGKEFPVSALDEMAQLERWWTNGVVTILRFEGEDVHPLLESAPPRSGMEDDKLAAYRKRKRAASATSDISMRPGPSKSERIDKDADGATDSPMR